MCYLVPGDVVSLPGLLISAISLEHAGRGLDQDSGGMTQLGSMLFTRCVSGAR